MDNEKVELNKINLEAWQIGANDLDMFKVELNAAKEKKLKEFEKENKEMIERVGKLSEELESEKIQFKEQALVLFEKTKEKQLLGGLGIREGTTLIYDSEEALKWAIEHSLALSLDKKRFEQLAKTESIDCVQKEPMITVTFPKEIKFKEC